MPRCLSAKQESKLPGELGPIRVCGQHPTWHGKEENEPATLKMLRSETVTSNPWASAGAFEGPLKYQLGWKVFLETEGTATWKKKEVLPEGGCLGKRGTRSTKKRKKTQTYKDRQN